MPGPLDALSSMRLGFALLALLALHAIVGMTPIGLLVPPGLAPDWVRDRTVAQLPAFEMTAGQWFATPVFRGLVAALLVNMLLSTLLRVPRRFSSLGAWSTHLGVVVLAIGGAWHAAHKVEGELTLTAHTLAPVAPDGQGPLSVAFADDRRAGLTLWIEGHPGQPTAELSIDLPGLPRFNDSGTAWDEPGTAPLRRVVSDSPDARVAITGFAADATVVQIEEQPSGSRRWVPLPTRRLEERTDWRGGYRASAIEIELLVPGAASDEARGEEPPSASLSTWVGFATGLDGAASRRLSDGRRVIILYTAATRAIEGHALRLNGFTVEPFIGTAVPRDFAVSVEVRSRASGHHADGPPAARRSAIIRLNDPLVLRDPEGGWLDRALATRRYTLSLQGWDDQGWQRDGHARFVVLKVSNAAGMPMIALGGWMVGLGVLWSVLLRPIGRAAILRARRPADRAGWPDDPKGHATIVRGRRGGAAIGTAVAGAGAGLLMGAATLALAAALAVPARIDGLSPESAQRLERVRHRVVEDAGARVSVESWLARRGRFIAGTARAEGVALGARLWLEPAGLIGGPVVAVPRGPLLESLLARADDPSIGRATRSGRRLPIEFVMEHLGGTLADGRASDRMSRDAELVLDRVETALSIIEGPPGVGAPTTTPRDGPRAGWRTALERADESNALLWLAAGVAGAWLAWAWLGRSGAGARSIGSPRSAGTGARGSRGPNAAFVPFAVLAITGAAFVARGLVAERIPMHNLHEALMLLALLSASGGALASAWRSSSASSSSGAVPLACVGVAGVACVLAAGVPVPGALVEREAGILASADLLAWHVGIVIAGYAAVCVNAALAVAWAARRGRSAALVAAMRRTTDMAFALLTVGIALGAWWAHSAWGRWWAFDPKETFSLVLWLVVLAGVHVRAAEPRRLGLWLAVAALAAMLAMLWNFVGVNLLLPGLHSYAS